MTASIEPLILDLLKWVAKEPRAYSDVMEAWKTSCPRLPIWEEANAHGFLQHSREANNSVFISVSKQGSAFLKEHRPVN